MNLYLISQTENDGYDTYDSAVVCAADEESARQMHPGVEAGQPWPNYRVGASTWCSSPDKVSVQLIGVAQNGIPAGVVLASFNAG